MRAIDIGVCEAVRIAETQVDVGLSGEVNNRIDLVPRNAVDHILLVDDISMDKCEILDVWLEKSTNVVQGCTVIQLVKAYDMIGVRVGQGKMRYDPACSIHGLRKARLMIMWRPT